MKSEGYLPGIERLFWHWKQSSELKRFSANFALTKTPSLKKKINDTTKLTDLYLYVMYLLFWFLIAPYTDQ